MKGKILTAVFLLLLSLNSFSSEPAEKYGILIARIYEADSDSLTYCRAWATAGDLHCFSPVASTGTPYIKDKSFSCNGEFILRLPAGSWTLHVEKGKEYIPQDREIEIRQGDTTFINIELSRWINMVQLGWYSMDIHCHFGADSLDILKEIALADDINFQPVLSQWNEQRFKTATYAWEGQAEESFTYADSLHLITFRNEEVERIGGSAFESVGALHLLGISDTVQASSHIFPPDAMLAETAKKKSPDCIIDMDKPNWGENVIGAALGNFNSAQLCHNHYHRFTNMRLCCGMA